MINKTELKAMGYLVGTLGYKESEITFNTNKSPDFTCSDGKRFEVKFLYGRQLLFSEPQAKNLKDKDTILVFNSERFIYKFLWKDRKKVPYTIKVMSNEGTMIRMKRSTKKLLDSVKLVERESHDDVIKRLIKYFRKRKEISK